MSFITILSFLLEEQFINEITQGEKGDQNSYRCVEIPTRQFGDILTCSKIDEIVLHIDDLN